MNEHFRAFVATSRRLAEARGLEWSLPCDHVGKVPADRRWNLTRLVGMVPPPVIALTHVGYDAPGLEAANRLRAERQAPPVVQEPMPQDWRDLYLAVIVHQVLVRKNKPAGAVSQVGRWIRLLAACSSGTPPWAIDSDQVRLGYNAALLLGGSGKLASNYAMMVRTVFDALHLADRPALARACVPFIGTEASRAQGTVDYLRHGENRSADVARLRDRLADRKSVERLPHTKALWELVRIIFTEPPKTFSDAIRFEALKIAVVTGLRVGEWTRLPVDCLRWREYFDAGNNPAGDKGGISRSLMLRHFAEKQQEDRGASGMFLFENTQHVPPLFETVVREAVDRVTSITAPLRERLRRQTETDRLFPEYDPAQLVPAWEMFVRVAGSVAFSDAPLPSKLVKKYREAYEPAAVEAIWNYQVQRLPRHLLTPTLKYWLHYKAVVAVRDVNGALAAKPIDWRRAYMRVGEVEAFVRKHLPTKLPDRDPARLGDGTLVYPHELLFLMPIRALIESRNGGLVDGSKYFAVGTMGQQDIRMALSRDQTFSLFARYGQTDKDRALDLNPHELRHLQNTELFRLGVADTIITKRFNRRSVAQSYEYDHRSLAEDLDNVELPESALAALGEHAQQTLRMIIAGKIEGPIVAEFRHIQKTAGDEAAFAYLEAEADGLHVTPYGFCLNSFVVDPCPKHLECFDGCRHLARTDCAEEQRTLVGLRDRMDRVIEALERTPVEQRSLGWQNQLQHARRRATNIGTSLTTRPSERPFPDGADLYRPSQADSTIVDAAVNRAADV